MVFHDIDMVILIIDIGYVLSIWEMTVSILSSWISIWDILSLCHSLVSVVASLTELKQLRGVKFGQLEWFQE